MYALGISMDGLYFSLRLKNFILVPLRSVGSTKYFQVHHWSIFFLFSYKKEALASLSYQTSIEVLQKFYRPENLTTHRSRCRSEGKIRKAHKWLSKHRKINVKNQADSL